MPSRNNPNKQTRLRSRPRPRTRVRPTTIATILRKPSSNPSATVLSGGLLRGRGISKKKERQKLRNVEYARKRAAAAAAAAVAAELEANSMQERGEVDMIDVDEEVVEDAEMVMSLAELSRTQRKKLERVERAAAAAAAAAATKVSADEKDVQGDNMEREEVVS